MFRHQRDEHPQYYRHYRRVVFASLVVELIILAGMVYLLRSLNLPTSTVDYVGYPLLAVGIAVLGFAHRRIMSRLPKSWKESGQS